VKKMLDEYYIERVMTKKQADSVVGEMVEDTPATISQPGIYRDSETQEAVLIYAKYPGDTAKLRRAVLSAGMSTTLRGSGMRNRSRTFGFATRSVVLQRENCRPASLAWDYPEAQMVLSEAADSLSRYFREVLPEAHLDDEKVMEQVLPEWRMSEDSLWTSGVINQSSQLPYHRDRANFETWSAMPVIRRGMEGGHLSMPEYDITVNCRDGYTLWFNGNKFVHGVTPMKTTKEDGYRYSIVFYALRGMKDCHTYAVEIGEARKRRTEREKGLADTDPDILAQRIVPRATGSATPGRKNAS
jgi:hypothetical protein